MHLSTPRRRARALAGVAATTLAAGLLSVIAAPAASAADDTAFYTPPSRLPSANGAIIRSTPVTLGITVNLPGMDGPLPAKSATRIMYKSTDSNNKPVAVTGTYIEPSAKWAAGGARPLVSFGVGTQGQGDACAPSKSLVSPLTVDQTSVSANYEIPAIYGLLSKGMAVVVTDYVGLGTTDRLHTYVNRVDQAHAVLDAARAAKLLPNTSLTSASKTGLYGYSQGGGASGAAAELARSYAPDVSLVGAYVGAPPADLAATLKGIDGTSLVAAVGWALNGFVQSYPQLKPILDANINAAGRAALAGAATACTVDAIFKYGFTKTSAWTNSGETVSEILPQYPAAQAIVDAQKIGNGAPSVPVRIVSGTMDDLVNHAQVKTLAKTWCGKGVNVTYDPIIQTIDTGGVGVNHIVPILQDAPNAANWIADRFAGRSAGSNCLLVPVLP